MTAESRPSIRVHVPLLSIQKEGQLAGRLRPEERREPLAQVGRFPESYDVLAVVPFGYPRRALGKGKKKREPLGEVVSSERFGTPLS